MVAIVAGNGLGLFNTSLSILGSTGVLGQSVLGQAGGRSIVNAATGNLVLQMQDEQLSGRGLDLHHLRTYNSLGELNDGDEDGWRWAGERTVKFQTSGNPPLAPNQAGTSVIRTDGDGHETTYTWNGSRYVSAEGSGAHDTLLFTNNQWVWTDGTTRLEEKYSAATANNAIGRLVSQKDTSGNSITFGYTNNRLTSVKDTSSQQELRLTYQQLGANGPTRLARVETRTLNDKGTLGGLVKQVEYGYTNGRLTSVTTDLTPANTSDSITYVTNYTYNAAGRIESMKQSDGSSVFFMYYTGGANDGKVATVKDSSSASSSQLEFSYGSNQTTITDGNGQQWVYRYDATTKQLTEILTPTVAGAPLSTKFEYDASGNVVRVTDARGNAVTYGYDANGNRTLERDALGNTVTRTFSTLNQVETETRYQTPDDDGAGPHLPGGGLTTRYVYNSQSRLRYVVSAEGRVSENRYSAGDTGLLTHTLQYTGSVYDLSTLPNEITSLKEAQLSDWVTGLTDKSKVQLTQFGYDLSGNLSKQTSYASADANGVGVLDAAATVTEYVYDPHGQLLQTIAVRGAARDQRTTLTSLAYDGLGREISRTSSSGTQTTVYDGANRQIRVTNTATGLVETRSYDTRGRLVSVSLAGDGTTRETKYVYNNADQLRMVEDPQGGRRFSFYDAAGRLEYTVDKTGAVTRFEYNATGQLTRETRYFDRVDTSGWYNSTTNTVNQTSVTVASNATHDRITSYGYDAAGRLETMTDAANVVTTTKYDGLSRVTMAQSGDRVARNLYDKDSRRVGMVDALGYLTEYKYDAAGRLIETVRYSTRSPAAANMTAPIWIGVTNQTAIGNRPFEYRVPAYDADGDTLSYSVVGNLPSWLTLDTTGATPILRGTPPATLTSYSVTLRASDNRGRTTDVSIAIAVVNAAPSWSDLPDHWVPVNVDGWSDFNLTLPAATDHQSTAAQLTYSILSPLPAGISFIPSERKLVVSGLQARGVYTITARVTDAQGLSVDKSFTLTVTGDPSSRSQWAAVPVQNLRIGQPFGMTVPAAMHPTGQALTYSVVSKPSWLSFNANTRELSGSPPTSAASFETVVLQATDANGVKVTLSFGLSVQNATPTWAPLTPMDAVAGIAASHPVPAATGQTLTYSVVGGLPPGLSFNPTTRTITGTSSAIGFYTVVLRATDARGQSVDRTLSLQIRSTATTPMQLAGSDVLADWRPTDTDGLRSYLYYDGQGRVVGSVDEQRFLTEVVYDEQANTQSTLRYLSLVTVSANATLAALRGNAGTSRQISLVQYDDFGRVSEVTALDGTTKTRNVYDGAGRLVRVVSAVDTSEQRASRTFYNAFGDITATLRGEGDAALGTNPTAQQISDTIRDYGMRYEHDALGRVIRTIDANGNNTLLYYDRENRLSHTVNVIGQANNNTLAGEVSETVYNNFGEVESTRRYANRITQANLSGLTGGAASQLQGKLPSTAANDEVTSHEYDRRGLLVKSTDGENFVTTNRYTAFGQLAAQVRTILQGRTTTTQFDYDLRGALLSQTADVGSINFNARMVYDAFGRVMQSIDAAGKITTTSYEDGGRRIVVSDPLNRTARTEYDALARRLEVTDPLGQVTSYEYDDAERSVTMMTPEGVRVTTRRTLHGEILDVKDGRGNITKYTYDKDGQLKTVTDALDQEVTKNIYDKSGRLFQIIDARGTITEFSYDQHNQVFERRVDPTGLKLKTVYEFNALGRQVRVTEGPGSSTPRVTTYAYDQKGQLIEVIVDPTGLKLSTHYTYDGLGNTLRVAQGTVASPNQQVTLYEFDSLGRRVKEIAAPSSEFGSGAVGTRDLTTQYRYDAAGRVSRRIDANGQSTWFVYDAAGQQTHTINGLGEVSQSVYDANGRLIHSRRHHTRLDANAVAGFGDVLSTFTPPAMHANDQRSYLVYDKDSRVRFTVQADIDTTWTISENRYDANGNVIEARRYDKKLVEARIDAIDTSTSPGITVQEIQDELGSAPLNYDDSKPNSLADIQRTYFSYDMNNRLRFTVDALGSVSESVHDAAGNLVSSVRFAVRPTLTDYTESEINAAVNRSDTNNQVSHLTYDAAGRLAYSVRVLSPGAQGQHLVSKQEYDALGRVVKSTAYATAIGLTTFTKQALDTATDNVSVKNHPQNRVSAVAYDVAGRLVYSVQVQSINTQGTATQHLVSKQEYDALGRVIKSAAYANTVGTLTDYQATTITSALNLNSAQDRTTAFVYDTAGRQRFVVGADGSLSETVYDALGQVRETRQFSFLVSASTPRTEAALSELRAGRAVGDGVTRGERYTYDRAGRVLTTADAKGFIESNVYNGLGDRTSHTDKNGATCTYHYDRQGRVFRKISPVVLVQLSSETAPVSRSREDRFYLDAFGNLIQKVEAFNTADVRTTDYAYDTLGRLVKTTLHGFYDPDTGKVESTNKMEGTTNIAPKRFRRSVEVSYDALGNVVRTKTRTSANSFQNEYKTYDVLGRLVHDVDALNHVTAFTYTTFGEQREVTRHSVTITGTPTNASHWTAAEIAGKVSGDSQARTITMSYDNLGRKTEVKQPTVQSYFFSMPGNGSSAATVTPLSSAAITKYEYNAFGEVHRERVKLNDVDGGNWRDAWHYHDVMGREILTVNEMLVSLEPPFPGSGYHTARSYDALGNLVKTVEFANQGNSGTSGNFTPPAAPSESTDDRITAFTYDARNQQASILRYGLRYTVWNGIAHVQVNQARTDATVVQTMTYDGMGNVLKRTDGLGQHTDFEYNALGQMTKVTEPGRMTATAGAIDPFQNQRLVSPVTTLTLDAFGNVVKTERNPGAGETLITRQSYDAAGNVISSTDANGNEKLRKVDYAGRVIEERQDISITLNNPGAYGGQGQLGTNNHTLKRRYAYDASGRQTHVLNEYMDDSEGIMFPTPTLVQSGQRSIYNAFGEVIEERRVWGEASATLGSLTEVKVATYSYDNAGHVVTKTAGDGVTQYFYDLTGQLTRQEQRGDSSTIDGTGTRITETVYDRLGRAIARRLPSFSAVLQAQSGGVTSPAAVTPWAWQDCDRWSNVTSRTQGAYEHGPGRFIEASTIAYAYNHDNQVIRETLPTVQAWRTDGTSYDARVTHELRYDVMGRVVQERDLADNAATTANEATELRKRSKAYDGAGQLIAETDATGIRTEYVYDAHGRKIGTKNALGNVFVDAFDKNGNLVSHGVLRQTDGKPYISGADGQTDPVVRWLQYHQYDQANRRYASADNMRDDGSYVVWTYTKHDERNLVRATSLPGNSFWLTTYEYDVLGNKTNQATGGFTKNWSYSYNDDYSVGRLTIGEGRSYHYNDFGQVKHENILNNVVPTRQHFYHDNGLLKEIRDHSETGASGPQQGADYFLYNDASTYDYTVKGELAREGFARTGRHDVGMPDGSVQTIDLVPITKTTFTSYDELGRMSIVSAPSGAENNGDALNLLQYKYDELGNVRNIVGNYTRVEGPSGGFNHWFTYDAEGRVTLTDGALNNGQIVIGSKGTAITYDGLGRRATTYQYSDHEFDLVGSSPIKSYEWDSYREEQYAYDDLGYLKKISARFDRRNVTEQAARNDPKLSIGDQMGSFQVVEMRRNDVRGAVEERNVSEFKDEEYPTSIGQFGPRTYITSVFNASGTLASQLSIRGYGDDEFDKDVTTQQDYFYNLDGTLDWYTHEQRTGTGPLDFFDKYQYFYGEVAGERKEAAITATRNEGLGSEHRTTSTTHNYYDNRGRLNHQAIFSHGGVPVGDERTTTRNFAYDSQNRIITQDEIVRTAQPDEDGDTAKTGRRDQFFANGRQIGTLGSGTLHANQFSFAYTPISGAYPGASPSNYVVGDGDTLAGIARAVWGDGSLWYLIADANSLNFGPDDPLASSEVGKSYRIPNMVNNLHHNANTFQPYNPARIIGDNTPQPGVPLPPAAQCISDKQLLSMVLIVAVTAVVTVFTAGAASAALPSVLGSIASGAIAGGIGAAAGSLAGQGTGVALGVQNSIDFRQVGLAGLQGAAGGAIGGAIGGGDLGSRISRSVVNTFADGFLGAVTGTGGTSHAAVDYFTSMANAAWGEHLGAFGKVAGPITNAALTGDWNRIAQAAVGAFTSVGVNSYFSWVENSYRDRVVKSSPEYQRERAGGRLIGPDGRFRGNLVADAGGGMPVADTDGKYGQFVDDGVRYTYDLESGQIVGQEPLGDDPAPARTGNSESGGVDGGPVDHPSGGAGDPSEVIPDIDELSARILANEALHRLWADPKFQEINKDIEATYRSLAQYTNLAPAAHGTDKTKDHYRKEHYESRLARLTRDAELLVGFHSPRPASSWQYPVYKADTSLYQGETPTISGADLPWSRITSAPLKPTGYDLRSPIAPGLGGASIGGAFGHKGSMMFGTTGYLSAIAERGYTHVLVGAGLGRDVDGKLTIDRVSRAEYELVQKHVRDAQKLHPHVNFEVVDLANPYQVERFIAHQRAAAQGRGPTSHFATLAAFPDSHLQLPHVPVAGPIQAQPPVVHLPERGISRLHVAHGVGSGLLNIVSATTKDNPFIAGLAYTGAVAELTAAGSYAVAAKTGSESALRTSSALSKLAGFALAPVTVHEAYGDAASGNGFRIAAAPLKLVGIFYWPAALAAVGVQFGLPLAADYGEKALTSAGVHFQSIKKRFYPL